MNEITWERDPAGKGGKKGSDQYPRNADSILVYASEQAFFAQPFTELSWQQRQPYRYTDDDGRLYKAVQLGNYSQDSISKMRDNNLIHTSRSGKEYKKYYLDEAQATVGTVWVDIRGYGTRTSSKERIGYPTEKPYALLERIISASSKPGDLLLDAFCGGGGLGVVAQRSNLNRRWIMIDQSRVAVAVSAEHLKSDATASELGDDPLPDFTVEHWGVYESEKLAAMPPDDFRQFVLHCFDARIPSEHNGIHGYKGSRARVPVWVGSPGLREPASAADVNAFAEAITRLDRYRNDDNLRDGVMLAWGFRPDATEAASKLALRDSLRIGLVRLNQVRLDSPEFRAHISRQSTDRGDYSEFLTFVLPPQVEISHKRSKARHLTYDFSASDLQVFNVGAKLINVQWDFDYRDDTFRADPGTWYDKQKGKSAAPQIDVQHTFPHRGTFTVACKVQDSKGGEGMKAKLIRVE